MIASRFPLGVAASISYSETFYRRLLVELDSLELAFLAARKQLALDALKQRRTERTLDWAGLQLYSRHDDGDDSRPIVFRPFRGLLSSEPEHRRFFFGRESELAEVLREQEERAGLLLQRRLSQSAQEWEHLGRDESLLYRGMQLARALEWSETWKLRMSALSRQFLDACRELQNREQQEAAARQQREREGSEKLRQMSLDLQVDRGYQLLFEKDKPLEALLWLHRAYQAGSHNSTLGDLLKSALVSLDSMQVFLDHTATVLYACWNPNGMQILTVSHTSEVVLFAADSGERMSGFQDDGPLSMCPVFSPDGSRFAVASTASGVRIYATDGSTLVTELAGLTSSVTGMEWSPDSRRVAVKSGSLLPAQIFDAATGALLTTLLGTPHPIRSLTWSPDGRWVVTAGNSAKIFAPDSGEIVKELSGPTSGVLSAAFASSGRYLATVCDAGTLQIFDPVSWLLIKELGGKDAAISSVAFSPDGSRILTHGPGQAARIYDTDSWECCATLRTDSVDSADWSPDGSQVAVVCRQKSVQVFDAQSGYRTASMWAHGGHMASARFGPSGQRILTHGGDHLAMIFSAETARLVAALPKQPGAVFHACYSPDNRKVITACADGVVRVFAAYSGQLLLCLSKQAGAVYSAVFSPDSTRIVTAGANGDAHIFAADSGHLLLSLAGHEGAVYSAVFAPHSPVVVTTCADGGARIFAADSGVMLARIDLGNGEYEPKHRAVTATWCVGTNELVIA